MGLRQKIHPEIHDAMHKMMKFNAFDLQRDIIYDNHRFKVLSIGRRWGKSSLEAADNCTVGALGGHVWCVAPTYSLADIIFDECLNLCADESLAFNKLVASYTVAEGKKSIRFITGGLITPKSTERPGSLIGRGLDKISFDECAKEADPNILMKYLMPCLSDRDGSLDMISTPEGHNWFYFEWLKGQMGLHKNAAYRSWQYASNTSAYFPQREWRYQKANMPSQIFEQEYEAQFLADGGTVFRNILGCTYHEDGSCKTVVQKRPTPGTRYVMAVDIARLNDWTVITIMEAATRKVVYIERFNQIDWTLQRERVYKLSMEWMAPCMIDQTGIGDVFIAELRHMNMLYGCEGYTYTNDSKSLLVNTLSLAFQNEEIMIPDDKLMRHELEIFRTVRSASGLLKYEAPTGYHDDIVMSLAMAYEMCLRHGHAHSGDAVVGEDDRGSRQVNW